ncbi:MAG: DUF882 domain-containing protein [Myxococcales bacterium]|nr:DUF882 domain-containing protein [Polyangiaceae bacterium]MDW8247735.1 DUF882 domain-containing protein [Myxococcales bacterium]
MAALIVRKMSAAFLLAATSLPTLLSTSSLTPDLPPVSPSQHLLSRKDATVGHGEGPWPPLATLFHMHSDEVLILDEHHPTLERWSLLLQDRVFLSSIPMAPEPLALLRTLAARHPGARIELVSGFRSPKLNEILRKKGHKVASHSQHSLGRAIDFRLIGLSPKELRQEIRTLGWKGGVGQYDKPLDQFVHIDTGRERSWFDR